VAFEATRESVAPVLVESSKKAEAAFSRTADTAATGFRAATEAGRDARLAVAATGAAAAGTAAGAFEATGSFVGALLRGAWSLMVFLIKTAILLGVAYAGWEWLQARRQNDIWSTPAYSPPGGSWSSGDSGGPAGPSGSAGYPSPARAAG
jgi:hypothetical protein